MQSTLASASPMPETPEQLHARVVSALQMPPVQKWDSFPFDGEMRPRPLRPPVEREAPREGEGAVDCNACTWPDERYIWTNETWRLLPIGPTDAELAALPAVDGAWAKIFVAAHTGELEQARALLTPLLEAEPRWAYLVRTLGARGFLPHADELLAS